MMNETVRKMTYGQFKDIIATTVGAVPDGLTFDEAEGIIGEKGLLVADIREVFEKKKRRLGLVPADNEWFDLRVDNNINPMDVVTSAGYNAKDWKYLGPELRGVRMYRAKLVRLGYVRNLNEAKKNVGKMGYRLVEGQANKSFRVRFSEPNSKGPVVFGGSDWQDPYGNASVVCLVGSRGKWDSTFNCSGRGFHDGWRWLVVDE